MCIIHIIYFFELVDLEIFLFNFLYFIQCNLTNDHLPNDFSNDFSLVERD